MFNVCEVDDGASEYTAAIEQRGEWSNASQLCKQR